jgi:hypothetical protein
VVGSSVVAPAHRPSRRALLGGGVAALAAPWLAACQRLPVIGGPPAPGRDVVLADEAADRERRLLAAYDAAAAAVPALAARLAPLRAEHTEHLAALGEPAQPAATATPTSSPSPLPVVPPQPTAALALLRDLEQRAAVDHGGAAVRCGRGLAVVLASLSASESSHAAALA